MLSQMGKNYAEFGMKAMEDGLIVKNNGRLRAGARVFMLSSNEQMSKCIEFHERGDRAYPGRVMDLTAAHESTQ